MAAPTPSMQGKVCLVTGATSGIGRVTAQALAQQGATVVLVGRNPERTAATVGRIQQETSNPHVECLMADLSAQAQVRQLAGEFQRRFARLDVLLNNAGAFFSKRHVSVDGIEMTLALNHLAYFLLTHLLLDTLKATPAARLVNVSSDAHRQDTVRLRRPAGGRTAIAVGAPTVNQSSRISSSPTNWHDVSPAQTSRPMLCTPALWPPALAIITVVWLPWASGLPSSRPSARSRALRPSSIWRPPLRWRESPARIS